MWYASNCVYNMIHTIIFINSNFVEAVLFYYNNMYVTPSSLG